MIPLQLRRIVERIVRAMAGYGLVSPLAVSLTSQTAACNSVLTCTTSYQDVSNATLTLAAIGTYLVVGVANIGVNVTAGSNSGAVQLLVGASAQSGIISHYSSGNNTVDTVSQVWLVTTTGTNTAIKLQGKKTVDNATAVTVYATDTTLTAIRLA